MKKILLMIIFITSFSFGINKNEIKWHSFDNLEPLEKVAKFGDIIIYNPTGHGVSMFGHIAMVSENNKVVDYPNLKYGFRESPLLKMNIFLKSDRKFVLLRYKYMNDEIKAKMIDLIDNEFLYKDYSLLTPPTSNTLTTYCSHFIWDLYRRTVGDVLDYNSNFIFPLDFLEADKYFEVVDF